MKDSSLNQRKKFNLNKKSKKNITIREKNHAHNLLYLWRSAIYIAFSGSLAWILVLNGWTPVGPKQISVIGNKGIKLRTILNTSYIHLNKPILQINPSEIEERLKENLPVKSVRIRRVILWYVLRSI